VTSYSIENFSAGVDTRKHALTAPAGTLRVLQNAHVTPGGEIEKRKAFVQAFDVTGTIGMARIGTTLYVFGTAASGPSGTFGGVTLVYQKLGTAALTSIYDWDAFDGKMYVTARPSTGGVVHFYNGAAVTAGKGVYIRTYRTKMYSVSGPRIYFSEIGDPTKWTASVDPAPNNGAGEINTSINDAEVDNLTGIEAYYDQLAFFSSRAIQLWKMDADPDNNILAQTIRSIGTAAFATPRQYGSGDILFLAPTGVRSLQARDSSNSGSVSDIGSPIDPIIQKIIDDQSDAYINGSRTMLEDRSGRFWLSIQGEIWVLSFFPGPKVTAWSQYKPTRNDTQAALTVTDMVDCNGIPFIRCTDNKIYAYGGAAGTSYDTCLATVTTPYLAMENPSKYKQFLALDAALSGTWEIEVSFDPDNELYVDLGTFTKSTFAMQRMGMVGNATHASLRFKSTHASAAKLASAMLHFNLGRDS
jgi:hypothetical protein